MTAPSWRPAARARRCSSAHARAACAANARRRAGGAVRRPRSSPHCRCRTPAAESTRARPAPRAAAVSRARSARLAPTPPATTSVAWPVASQRAQRLGAQRVDDRILHAAGDVGALTARSAAWPFTASITAVFSPEKLKSSPGRSSIGRGKRKRPGRPWSARRASSGPPGYGSPSSLAVLSKASPAASSRVSPSSRYWPMPRASISSVWPPDTSSARCGNPRRRILQQRRQQVALQVMHADGRQPPAIGQGLRQRRAGQQRADQARARRVGNAAEFSGAGPGRRQGLAHQRQQAAHVVARGQLRHDAAVEPVQVDLAVEAVRQQAAHRWSSTATALSSQEDSIARTRMEAAHVCLLPSSHTH